jgi:hypothetical protein
MLDTPHDAGPFEGMSDRAIHTALMQIDRLVGEGATLETAKQHLLDRGLTPTQATAALRVFTWNSTLVSEGPFAGLTERQKDEAINRAYEMTADGMDGEKTIRELVAGGITQEQAIAALASYRANELQRKRGGAPRLIVSGILLLMWGIGATYASMAMATSYYRVMVGAIFVGTLMILVGLYRKTL